ncbi:MAG: tetratricopeptide repeat protein [Myxococcales bacterium]|nr:MAG: tetratricopeptide repeat protein [Myxococcales bacterium]
MSDRLDMLKQVIDAGSADPFHWYAYAMELRKARKLAEALVAFDEVSARFPDYVPTYLMAGQCAQEGGDLVLAKSWFDRGIQVAAGANDTHALSELHAASAALLV